MSLMTALLGLAAAVQAPTQPAPPTEVYLVGALHQLHEREESFTFDQLGRIVHAIDADVLVLEVTPDELAGRTATPGRPEYPAIIWPILAQGGVEAHAMEAGQPEYGEMTGAAGRIFGALASDRPEDKAILDNFQAAQQAVLLNHWRSPADAHDDFTAELAQAGGHVRDAIAGSESATLQTRWDGGMIAEAQRVIAANPGRRILILASYRNRHIFEEALRDQPGFRLVDMQAWLRANAR